MGDEPERIDEEWVYLGPTMTGGHAWRDPQGETFHYKKLKGRVFGGIYTVSVVRSGDSISASVDPPWSGRRAEDSAEVEIRARAVEVRLAISRMEKNAARMATLDEAIAPLVAIAAGLLNTSDRTALMDYIGSKVYAARRPRT